jgi:DME family drug/metabolite transporter
LFSLVLSGIFWGTGGITGDLLGREAGLPALAIAAYRLIAGGLLILLFLAAKRAALPRGWAAWRRIALIGSLAAFFQACYFASIALTSVSIATLISIGASPVMVLAAERLSGRRRLDRWSLGTAGLALTGFLLLTGVPSAAFTPAQVLAGSALALCAAAGFATVTMVSTRPVPGLDDLATTGYGFTLGGAALMIVAAPTSGIGFQPGFASIGLVILLATLPTAVAYTLFFRGLRVVTASTAALIALLEPLTGALLAALLLGDRLSGFALAGAVLMIGAVATAALSPRTAT